MGSYLVFCRDENGTFRGCAMTVEATVAALEPWESLYLVQAIPESYMYKGILRAVLCVCGHRGCRSL